MGAASRQLDVGDWAVTDYNTRGGWPMRNAPMVEVQIVAVDRHRTHGHSQSGVMFQVRPMLKNGTAESWYDADWFEPVEQSKTPQRCPVCDGEWPAEGCELGEEVSRRLKAETEAVTLRGQLGAVSGWIVEALKVLDTVDPDDSTEADDLGKLIKAGEVLALATLARSKTPNVGGEPETTARTNL